MSWRIVVISNVAKLDLKLNHMVIRNEKITKISLSEIHTLIIESTAVSMTAALMVELMKRKIKVIFCDEKRNPNSELIPYYGSHDTVAKIRNQIQWDNNFKKEVWTELIREKIKNQAKLLKKLDYDEFELLEKYIEEIQIGDISNREAHAAKVYFNTLFGKSFSRAEDNSINAALNYGYSLILSAVNREVAYNGYLTALGIFHDNMFNHFNLSSDLMEIFRPLVDELVYSMNIEKFEIEEKHEIINILNKSVYIDGRNQYLTQAIKIYCKSVLDAMEEKDLSLIRFYRDEL
ncbi:MAG: type II CRISPR-associated endonuclease Cas1 [Fusobacterium gastrosuis]|uniref:type II CRISPR-associated endonuclease Cas1 n=1 Tax=Fusobacterium gastrosuis TaxID=1755100 RepID=UPI0029709C30|nr:type II CRISPR-associated endonuclease Cas1 [Fusobacteriaceae bacterium]MDY4010980.1 type II CRISPR-associated endonuclease Cas1 [Fusobacterium gastrosuis]MDY5306380.1 type II CRISPR-associated endonuclease Cas1 [Fusobacterium gastrosuis]MDY5713297.1 type II CRISPR-associated endonuclease Cas1 [Fusobacterium gastrosuis]